MSAPVPEAAHDLLAFIDASPTPYHAVATCAARLDQAGFSRWVEGEPWPNAAPGTRAYVVRNDGSIVAFIIGTAPLADVGVHIVGAHTDSPNLRLKPVPDVVVTGLRTLAVEPYGGVLIHTWFDRDCSLAGRVAVRQSAGRPKHVLVDCKVPLARTADLAIHLQRELRKDGFKPNAQTQLPPLFGLETCPPVLEVVADRGGADLDPRDIAAFELMLYDVQPSALSGAEQEFVHAARLDNLGSCHAGLSAFMAEADTETPFTRMIAFWDHEEVGSRSAQGAAGTFLQDVLVRLCDGDGNAVRQAIAHSLLVSADMAHAVHPNYVDRHDPGHMPALGGGPVVKWNQNQRYASDAGTAGWFVSLCRDADVPVQQFAVRSDMACGTTIGPISSALLGMPTVDVGNPMLSMHSCREMCATADVPLMIKVLRRFFRPAHEVSA